MTIDGTLNLSMITDLLFPISEELLNALQVCTMWQGSAHTGWQWFKTTSTSKNRLVPS